MASDTAEDRALAFACGQDRLYGILSMPGEPGPCGVLIVVGGPQYRAGSHRQFTLLARSLAAQGIAAMRFDYRGMGDSEGAARSFDTVGEDLRAAIDGFMAAVPGLRKVVLWGLCDGASAAALYAAGDARVRGLVLLNPWVRTEEGIARTTLKHYYRGRLMERAFWRKLVRGQFDLVGSLQSLAGLVRAAMRPRAAVGTSDADAPLHERIHAGLRAFDAPIMIVISGADLTAREFCDLTGATPAWKRLLNGPHVTWRRIDKADHTFSRRAWRDQVSDWTCEWVRSV